MKDKDLLVVIAEMLSKQDQHSEILNLHTQILNQHTQILEKTNETLGAFADVSIKQFEQQQIFNERFLDSLNKVADLSDKMVSRLDAIEKKL